MEINSRRKLCLIAILVCMLGASSAISQTDTVRVSIAGSEKLFLQNNLSLLAARYNIDATKALVRQAKFWDNPVLSTDQNIYASQEGFFKHGPNQGQVYVQVMQLIKTAGKRSKAAKLAEDNTTLSVAQFDDLLRTLRYTLITDLYEIDHQLKIKRVYNAEINELQTLVKGMDEQLRAGNISVKDNIRIKALLFSLQNELINADAQILPVESEVKLFLHNSDSSFVLPEFNYYLSDLINVTLPSKDSLIKVAEENRPDVRLAHSQLDFANHNLSYQKALAKADISVGTEYDLRSSYSPDYVGLAISLPLNILNRNQGNITSAQYNIKQQQTLYDYQVIKVDNDIYAAISKVKFYQDINNAQQLNFSNQYDTVFQNMLKSYKQRQVSLLEFIDFADAYTDTKLKLLEQHTNLLKAVTELNYQTGKDVIILNK